MHSYGLPASSQRRGMWVAPRQETASHRAEEIVEHVAPVAQHIEDDAAAVFLAVVPGGALRRARFAFEHPVAEFAAHGEDAAEEALPPESLELQQAGQPQLVLHHAVLDAGAFGQAVKIERRIERTPPSASRNRRACRRRSPGAPRPRAGRWSARRNRSSRPDRPSALSRSVVQGRPPHSREMASSLAALRPTSSGRGMMVSPSLRQHAALLHDGVDGAEQVLVRPHAPGDAVHDDADGVLRAARSRVWPFGRGLRATRRPAAAARPRRRAAGCHPVPAANAPRRRLVRSSRSCAWASALVLVSW